MFDVNETEQSGEDLSSADAKALSAELESIEREYSEEMPTAGGEIAEQFSTADALMGVVSPAFDIIAPNWRVTYKEKQSLCTAYGAVIDKYFPNGDYSKWLPEIMALGVTVSIFSSRAGVPRVAEEGKDEGGEIAD